MTSLVFKTLLASSLVANGALAFALWSPPVIMHRLPGNVSSKIERIVSEVGGEPDNNVGSPNVRPPLTSEEDRKLLLEAAARFGKTPALGDPRALAERMYREGYPDDVVMSVVSTVLDEWLGGEARRKAKLRGDPVALRLSAINSGGGPLQKYMQDLFPHWREQLERQKARDRELRFGTMPLEKILTVERLEREIDSSDRRPVSAGGAEWTELHQALTSVLTAEELADYLRFNSPIAKQVQRDVIFLDIDEATYDRLLAVAMQRFEERRGLPLVFLELEADYRGILRDEQLVQLIPHKGSQFSQPDRLYRAAGLTDTQRVDFFVMAAGFFSGGERDRSRRSADAKAAREQIHAALAVSPESLEAFEATTFGRSLKKHSERKE